jgi:DNA-binding transcriptional ArsR family regulator
VGDASSLLCVPSAYVGSGFATISFDLIADANNGGHAFLVAYGADILPKIATDQAANEDIVPEIAPTETYQDVYRLLADPARWALIRLLVARPCYGQELSELLGLSIATVSHHLNGLKRLDLVRIEREEHRLYYHLRTDRLRALLAGAEQQLLR